MPEAMTIFDPNAPIPEAYVMQVAWLPLACAAAGLLLMAFVLHRYLRRRLRATAIELASRQLLRAIRLDRAGHRGLRVLARASGREVPVGVLLLNRSRLMAAAAAIRVKPARSRDQADVERLMSQLGLEPVVQGSS